MLREEHWVRAFENRVLKRIFGPKRDKVTGEWSGEDYITRSFMICNPHQILLVSSNREEGEMGRACGTCGRREKCIHGFGGETVGKEITWKTWASMGGYCYDCSSRSGIREAWTGFFWLRIGTGGGVLVNMVMNLQFTYSAGNFLTS
jgi:hypothetical protein